MTGGRIGNPLTINRKKEGVGARGSPWQKRRKVGAKGGGSGATVTLGGFVGGRGGSDFSAEKLGTIPIKNGPGNYSGRRIGGGGGYTKCQATRCRGISLASSFFPGAKWGGELREGSPNELVPNDLVPGLGSGGKVGGWGDLLWWGGGGGGLGETRIVVYKKAGVWGVGGRSC